MTSLWTLATIVICLLAAGAFASTIGSSPVDGSPVRTIVLTIHHSRFSAPELHVRHGETVRFEVRNTDPIDHELIVGPMAVQRRHQFGRETRHPPVPGEVGVPLLQTASTSYTFSDRGTIWFACQLPGHWAYGMRGRIIVGG